MDQITIWIGRFHSLPTHKIKKRKLRSGIYNNNNNNNNNARALSSPTSIGHPWNKKLGIFSNFVLMNTHISLFGISFLKWTHNIYNFVLQIAYYKRVLLIACWALMHFPFLSSLNGVVLLSKKRKRKGLFFVYARGQAQGLRPPIQNVSFFLL